MENETSLYTKLHEHYEQTLAEAEAKKEWAANQIARLNRIYFKDAQLEFDFTYGHDYRPAA